MVPYRSRGPKFDGLVSPLPRVDEESILVTPLTYAIVPTWPDNMSNNHVYITCVVNPGTFYIHSHTRRAQYEAMMKHIMNVAPFQPTLARFSEGTLCFFKHLGGWHRAQIQKEGKYALEVLSIDLGRIDYVEKVNKKSALRVMPLDIAKAESFAECCSLPIEPIDDDDTWCDEAMHLFGGLCDQICEARTVDVDGSDEEITYIELHFNSVNVAEELVSRGFALSLFTDDADENAAVQLPALPSSQVQLLSFTSINNFQVLFINQSLMMFISKYRVGFCSFGSCSNIS
jgi:Tudor domain